MRLLTIAEHEHQADALGTMAGQLDDHRNE